MIAQTAFLERLFDWLWKEYRDRVSHARAYEDILKEHGGTFRNDHLAFRTFAAQERWSGIASIARPFEALGYRAAGAYDFPDKHLTSLHFAPPSENLPRLFVSELRVWELSPRARRIALAAAAKAEPGLSDEELAGLSDLPRLPARKRDKLLRRWAAQFGRRWPAPKAADALALEKETQFGAWVLLHGHTVNHFTAAVHAHGVSALDDIEKTVAAMKKAGVPMKPDIEGDPGTKLRQSSTQAVVIPVEMRSGARLVRKPWTYAYFEIAERPMLDGRRFEGFLGGQATNLFEMTRRS
ncbi:MAG: DUF1338 domain-containing protein [Elusimicrobiota bacterium]|nr:MAG: DUF1338 domain-containing protein [Elusimicrobiota bacterium]